MATHYKVSFDVWRKAGFSESAFVTFCGIDIRYSGNLEFFHFLGEDEQTKQPVVDCPRCRVLYDTVIHDYLDTRGN